MGRKNKKDGNYWEEAETIDESFLDKEKSTEPKQETNASNEGEISFTGKKKKSTKDKSQKSVTDSSDNSNENKSDEQSSEKSNQNSEDQDNIVFSGKKKKKGKSTKSDESTLQDSGNDEKLDSENTEKQDDKDDTSTPSEDSTEKTKSTKDDAAKKKKKKAGEKEDKDKKKKGGIGKKLAEQILKMREEEEKKKQMEEEKRKREEEEYKRQLEEERLREEELQKQREIQKQIAKEKKIQSQKEQEQKRLQQIREQLMASHGVIVPSKDNAESTGAPKLKRSEEKKKKKAALSAKQQQETKEEVVPQEQQTTPVQVQIETPPQPVVEEPEVSWEDQDWESKITDEFLPAQDTQSKSVTTSIPAKEESKPSLPSKVEDKGKPAKQSAKAAKKTKEEAVVPATPTAQSDETADQGQLRSPIVCIVGHVDTGKTKLLDKIRHTNVQEGEAGGITQQIGATFFPMEAVKEQTKKLSEAFGLTYKVPGLLIIDTPGHESFNNLRSRGTSLCDVAILVVDIMHGLEPQTIESINLLKMRKTPFIVALNKVDRIYGWQASKDEPIQDALKKQPRQVIQEYEDRVKDTIAQFAGQSLNAQLYYKNKSLKEFRTIVSLVPTSAIEGTGVPDLLMLLVQLTQKLMTDRLVSLSTLQCTILEVKVVEGLGTTIDVILVNGTLTEEDTIVVCGMNGPIVTKIRALLTPQPLKEMRVKGTYIHHKVIHAAQGVKIVAPELDKAVAGSSLFVLSPNSNVEEMKEEVMQDLENMKKKVDTTGRGVWVQASTLGSLEALLEFLKESKIPVSGVNIGPVNKKDVVKASVMLEHQPEYAVILAFDVKVSKEAREVADDMGVKIFTAEIIYHLFDQFTAYIEQHKNQQKTQAAPEAVFPARIKIFPEYIFNKKDPIVLGVEVLEGSLRLGTPIVVPSKDFIELGRITSIEQNHKTQEKAKKGSQVAIKIEVPTGEQQKAFGRHFDHNDELVSKITRQSLDLLKANFREELDKEDVQLLKKLKDLFTKYGKFGV